MSEKILNVSPPLTYINFFRLFTSEETADEGHRLLHALTSITQPTLLSLDLGYNRLLWEADKRFSLLLDLLQQQYNLKVLNLRMNYFSAVQTE